MKILRSALACTILSVCTASTAMADMYIIVNATNPTVELNKKKAIDIFMGRTKAFKGGISIQAIDQPKSSPTRELFYTTLTGKSLVYVNAYWARLFYSGRNRPPKDSFANEDEIIEEVATNQQAIAYVADVTDNPNIKIVMTIETD